MVIAPLRPSPLNWSRTVPGGTAFSTNFPDPSIVAVMSVPTMVTVLPDPVLAAVLDARRAPPVGLPTIVPAIVAPFAPADGAAGMGGLQSPHAVVSDASAASSAKAFSERIRRPSMNAGRKRAIRMPRDRWVQVVIGQPVAERCGFARGSARGEFRCPNHRY